MFPSTTSRSICLSITRLRSGAIICCWIVGLALACQALIWSLASYTQMRYAEAPAVEKVAEPAATVKPDPQPAARGRILSPAPAEEEPKAARPEPVVAEASSEAETSKYDRIFAAAFDLAGGTGRIAMIVLVAALGLGVALAANAAVSGGERAVLAFIWATLVAVLVLPLGNVLHLPWEDGALSTYAQMTSWVDQIEAARTAALADEPVDEAAPSSLLSHARFLLLPLACIIGVILVGLRFSAAVEPAVVKRESMKLDPALEREAANIAPTSLHGARGASIVSRAIAPDDEPEPERLSAAESAPNAPPKRLI